MDNRKITKEDDIRRFMQHVVTSDECWIWTGAKNKSGYGYFRARGKTFWAHRYALEMIAGIVLGSDFACHHCDNPSCVNPKHLFAGDAQSNMDDMVKKGRYGSRVLPCGAKHFRAKISDSDVADIRESNKPSKELAEQYGLAQTTINNIKSRRTWASVI